MIGSNLTHEQYMELFGQGMGLLTVGAAWLVAGLQGPFTGTLYTVMLALGTPFLLTGLVIILLPAFVSIEPEKPDRTEPTTTEDHTTFSSSAFPSDD